MQIRKGGSWRTSTSAYAFINGAWRQILNGKAYVGGQWRNVANFTTPTPSPTPTPTPTPTPAMSLKLSATSISGSGTDTPITTNTVTITPSGGKSPYKYQWSIVSSDGHAFSFTAPNSATTAVSIDNLVVAASATCSIHCVVNDSTGLTQTSSNVSATLSHTAAGNPGGQGGLDQN